MFENWQKLVSLLKNFVLFLRIPKLHDVKQNEKYPYAHKFTIFSHSAKTNKVFLSSIL